MIFSFFFICNLINWAIMHVHCIYNKIYSLTIWPEQNYNGLKRHSSDYSNSKMEFNKKKHRIFRIKEEKTWRKFFFLTSQFLFSKHSMIYLIITFSLDSRKAVHQDLAYLDASWHMECLVFMHRYIACLFPQVCPPPLSQRNGACLFTLVPGPGVLGPPASIKVILMHKRAELIKYNLIKNSISWFLSVQSSITGDI